MAMMVLAACSTSNGDGGSSEAADTASESNVTIEEVGDVVSQSETEMTAALETCTKIKAVVNTTIGAIEDKAHPEIRFQCPELKMWNVGLSSVEDHLSDAEMQAALDKVYASLGIGAPQDVPENQACRNSSGGNFRFEDAVYLYFWNSGPTAVQGTTVYRRVLDGPGLAPGEPKMMDSVTNMVRGIEFALDLRWAREQSHMLDPQIQACAPNMFWPTLRPNDDPKTGQPASAWFVASKSQSRITALIFPRPLRPTAPAAK